MSALVAVGVFGILLVVSLILFSNYRQATLKAIELGSQEDMRNYMRRLIDCQKTLAKETATCDAGGFIKGYDKNDRALMEDPSVGLTFEKAKVKIRCEKGPQSYNLTATVKYAGSEQTKDLFDVPLTCAASNCGALASDPDPITIGGGPFVLLNIVRTKALSCAMNLPNEPFRKGFSASGGGFRWNTPYGPDDTVTLDKICDIMGYDNYVSSTCLDTERSGRYPNGKCNFHSPSDNDMTYFNGSTWIVRRNPPKYNWIWTASITCSGKR